MNVQIGRWGNSLGVRIPSSLAKHLDLREGSEVDLEALDGTIVLRPRRTVSRYKLEELLAQVTPENIHEETAWGEPQGKEEW